MSQYVASAALFILVLMPVRAAATEPGQTPPPTFGVPNTNPRPPSTSPVQVESCKIATRGGEVLAKTGDLEIQFTNEGDLTADVIRFRVRWSGDDTSYIRDAGRFSPGVTVTHRFRQARGQLISPLFSRPNLRCAVETVHFTDGSVWTNPNAGVDESSGTETTH